MADIRLEMQLNLIMKKTSLFWIITLNHRVDYIFSTVHKFKGLECDTVENVTFQ